MIGHCMHTCAFRHGVTMPDLLIRPDAFLNKIENFGYEYLYFEVRKMAKGESYDTETGGNELAVVVLGHHGIGLFPAALIAPLSWLVAVCGVRPSERRRPALR